MFICIAFELQTCALDVFVIDNFIFNKKFFIKGIGKTLLYERQEDAHEFIKLLLDHMEKSFLLSVRGMKLDHRSKETTPLNQIFGGYLRQQGRTN